MSTSEGALSDLDAARLLAENGRYDDAQAILLVLLGREPRNAPAIVELGRVVLAGGSLEDAETILRHAVRTEPTADAYAMLGYALAAQGHRHEAKFHYEAALAIDPLLASARHGLGALLEALGDAAGAARERQRGFRARPVTFIRRTSSGDVPRVVLLGTAQTGNTPLADLIDPADFAIAAVVTEYADATLLPEHDVIVNAIGEADRCGDVLARAHEIARGAGTPLVNAPERVAATGRVAIADRVRGIEGVVVPEIGRMTRDTLRRRAIDAPFLVRQLGHHSGELFFRVDDEASRAHALAACSSDDLLATSCLDARAADGLVRKYRLLFIDGSPYPVHAAIGNGWKLHFGAGRRDAQAISEDAAFLADPAAVVGARGMAALDAIRDTLGLDYGGVDFGLDRAGNVLFFEANATMSAPLPGPDAAYRGDAMNRIRRAVREMIAQRARVNAG